MQVQTATRSAECELHPDKLYRVLAEPANIPKWAPAFADSLERVAEGEYLATKGGQSFPLYVLAYPEAGAVDYLRDMPGGRRGGAYLRVTPRPLGGSTLVMTVPVGPDTTEAEVGEAVQQELAHLIRLA